MSDKCFLDTNILVYAFMPVDPRRHRIARGLLHDGLKDGTAVISWQVVQEFLNVALRKNSSELDPTTLADAIRVILLPLCKVWPSPDLWHDALRIHRQTGYGFYDSLVVAGALMSGARRLLSEDLQHGRLLGELRIENPFAE